MYIGNSMVENNTQLPAKYDVSKFSCSNMMKLFISSDSFLLSLLLFHILNMLLADNKTVVLGSIADITWVSRRVGRR